MVSENIFNQELLKAIVKDIQIPDIETKQNQIKFWYRGFKESNLAKAKEESIKGQFFIFIIENVLGYKNRAGNILWHTQQEQKTDIDGTKADGSLGFFTDNNNDVRVVIELKDASTDLDKKQNRPNKISPVEQAFSYKYKMKHCKWVIVSNFVEIRLYHSSTATEYERFTIEELAEDKEVFKKFYFLLHKENLIKIDGPSVIDNLYENSGKEKGRVFEMFLKEYNYVQNKLKNYLLDNNPDVEESIIAEKNQKILDRFIFVFYCEDSKLLPKKIFRTVLELANLPCNYNETKYWNQLKGMFHSIDKDYAFLNINKLNSNLFKVDEILDNLVIKDDILLLFQKLTEYGYDVHTPSNVTQYTVENIISRWFSSDKRIELDETKLVPTGLANQIVGFWEQYRDAPTNIPLLDPACGSGGFLNTAFNYLLEEGKTVKDKIADICSEKTNLFNLAKYIFKNNLLISNLNLGFIGNTQLSLSIKKMSEDIGFDAIIENPPYGIYN